LAPQTNGMVLMQACAGVKEEKEGLHCIMQLDFGGEPETLEAFTALFSVGLFLGLLV